MSGRCEPSPGNIQAIRSMLVAVGSVGMSRSLFVREPELTGLTQPVSASVPRGLHGHVGPFPMATSD